jgi:hypothetical protein
MTLEEIRQRRAELDEKLKRLNKELDHIKIDYQHLYLECDHPRKFETNCMGRWEGWHCPDCGKDT